MWLLDWPEGAGMRRSFRPVHRTTRSNLAAVSSTARGREGCSTSKISVSPPDVRPSGDLGGGVLLYPLLLPGQVSNCS